MSRVLIVSNRLPITVQAGTGGLEVQPSVGGLATGLRGPHERSGGVWIGWSGLVDPLPEGDARALQARLEALRLVPVELTPEEVHRYYESYSNGVLWPLFHYFADQVPLEIEGFDDYERVNRRFADAAVAHHQPGDLIWVHDYQLMRVPALIREQLPDARIGFFLHIPFPSSETFRIRPQRRDILEGLLGADVLGFHTASYVRHFSSSVLRTCGAWTQVDRIPWRGREVSLGVFPMGTDAVHWAELAAQPGVLDESRGLRADPQRLLVGIDRLDYTKGIPRRLLAFELLLVQHPELRERVRLVQVAVPSRTGMDAYQGLRETVDGLVGRINGRFATPSWSPVHYLFRSLSEPEVAALYRAADALVVTPTRDGMNLVSKEFIASRTDGDGVLVLSEFTGAAADPEFGTAQAGDLLLHLATLLSNVPAEVLTGDRVVEIRPQGVNKGQVVPLVLSELPPGGVLAAVGDDRTDEDLFVALPPKAISLHVGPSASRAELRVRNVGEVRTFLRGLLQDSR